MNTNNQRVDELCDKISNESDFQKILPLAQELNQLLEKECNSNKLAALLSVQPSKGAA